ncbi:MAG: hypothetical protein HQ568_04940 [Calditrichaeota bacterium]|nr:hypothetical protein [Calditrichota bacterium]
MPEMKTIIITCQFCEEPFTVRLEVHDPKAEGESETLIPCLKCGEIVKVSLPCDTNKQTGTWMGIRPNEDEGQ